PPLGRTRRNGGGPCSATGTPTEPAPAGSASSSVTSNPARASVSIAHSSSRSSSSTSGGGSYRAATKQPSQPEPRRGHFVQSTSIAPPPRSPSGREATRGVRQNRSPARDRADRAVG